MNNLQTADPEIWQAVQREVSRQQDGLEMIASENYTSRAVMEAQGSVLTNKYAEGLPGIRADVRVAVGRQHALGHPRSVPGTR